MALKSPHDPRDLIYEQLASSGNYTQLPPEFSLAMNSPRDQGRRGTCAAFTGMSIAEYHNAGVELSPEFIYHHRESPVGMYARNVFSILKKLGVPEEDLYPYCESDCERRPTRKIYKRAKRYRITGYARLNSIDGIKRALVESGPVYISLPMYNDGPTFWKQSSDDETAIGHAVTITGYDREGFIFKNSWGTEWNQLGYGLLPFADFNIVYEIWTAIVSKVPATGGILSWLRALLH